MMARWMLLLGLVFMLTGCGSLSQRDQLDRFDFSLRQYGASLRWARYAEAHGFHLSREGKQPIFDREKLENFSVTGMQVLERAINPEKKEANIYIEISYYNEQEGTVKKIREKQLWWYNEDLKHWFTEADMPDFK